MSLEMGARQTLEPVAEALARQGLGESELFIKQGTARRFEVGLGGRLSSRHRERGWAVRATGERSSLFVCGTGVVPAEGPWPEPDGFPIPLPPASPGSGWRPPTGLEAPLMVDSEAMELLEVCSRELEAELKGAHLLRAVLEDGASESAIASSRGIEAQHRGRAATLLLEALGPGPRRQRVCELFAAREACRFHPRALVRRLADRLILGQEGRAVERDRADVLLGPAVGVRILQGLLPLLLGRGARGLARALADRADRLASRELTIVDDGGLRDGLMTAPVDGEGVPTRRLVLVEDGLFRRPLQAWFQRDAGHVPHRVAGCVRRAGWRDLPRLAPSHLFVEPQGATAVASLLSSVARGYYFSEALAGGRFDVVENRFRLPVCGFEVRSGRAVGTVSRAVLCGRVSALLQGIQAVGRDLAFFPLGVMLGSPSLLVAGLELDDSVR